MLEAYGIQCNVCRWHQLFFTQNGIRYFFQIVNQESEEIGQCYISNKFSLNILKKQNAHFSLNLVTKRPQLGF